MTTTGPLTHFVPPGGFFHLCAQDKAGDMFTHYVSKVTCPRCVAKLSTPVPEGTQP